MRILNLFLLVAVVATLTLTTGCAGGRQSEEAAQYFLYELNSREYARAHEWLHPGLQEDLDEERLAEFRSAIVQTCGGRRVEGFRMRNWEWTNGSGGGQARYVFNPEVAGQWGPCNTQILLELVKNDGDWVVTGISVRRPTDEESGGHANAS